MGNVDPANPEASIPGQVYFAVEMDGKVRSYYVELKPQPTRRAYKLAVAKEIYDAVMEQMEESQHETAGRIKKKISVRIHKINLDSEGL